MKNFFKKLSFVMAAAMVVTSLHVPAEAKAASKDYVYVKGSKKAVTAKSLFVGGQTVNFDYVVGKLNNKGANGKWSITDTTVATVNKDGVVKAVGVGETTLTFTAKKSKKVKKAVKKTVKLTTYARAEAVVVSPASLEVVTGNKAEADVMLTVKEELEKAGVKSSYMTFAEIDNASAAAVKVEAGKLMVEAKDVTSTPATITVYAAQKNTLEAAKANKYAKKAEVKLTVKSKFSAMQAGANKITVVGENLATNPALYVLKNDRNVKLELKKDELKPENGKVTLVTETSIINPGKYTLTFNEKENAELEIVEAKVKEIKFLNDNKAVLDIKSQKATVALVRYQVLDQFGDDVTNTGIPELTVSSSATSSTEFNRGLIKVINDDSTPFKQNIDNVFVNIVDTKAAVQASGNFVVSSKVLADKISFAGIYDIKNLKKVDKLTEANKDDIENMALMFEVLDQYGNVYEAANNEETAKELTTPNRQYGVNVTGFTGLKLKGGEVLVRDIQGKKYVLERLAKATELRAGDVDVTTVCYNNGKVAKDTFSVGYRVKVNDIRFSEGPKGVYNGQDNELSFYATDIDGNSITKYDDLKRLFFDKDGKKTRNVTVGSGTITLEKGDKGEGIVKYNPSIDGLTGTDHISVNINVVTETLKTSSQSITVYAKRYPVKLVGIKSDAKVGLTDHVNSALEFKFGDFEFLDQYKNPMSANEIAALGGYRLNFKLKDASEGTVDAAFEYKNFESAPTVIADIQTNNGYDVNFAKDGKAFQAVVKALTATHTRRNKVEVTVKLAHNSTPLYQFESDEIEKKFNIYNIKATDAESFAVDAESLKKVQPAADLYTKTDSDENKKKRTYFFKPAVYGKYDGVNIMLHDNDYVIFEGVASTVVANKLSDYVNQVETVAGERFVKVPDMKMIPAGKTEATEKLQIIIKGVNDRISAEYKYSKAPRKVAKVEATEAGLGKANNGVHALNVSIDNVIAWNTNDVKLKEKFNLYDQYGVDYLPTEDVKPFITFSVADADKAKVEYKSNGTIGAQVTIKQTVELKVSLKFPGSDKPFDFKIKVTAS